MLEYSCVSDVVNLMLKHHTWDTNDKNKWIFFRTKKKRINGWYSIIESKLINLNFVLSGMTSFRVIMTFEWSLC